MISAVRYFDFLSIHYICRHGKYVTLLFRPTRYINFFEPFYFFTAGDQLVVPVGVSHISLPLHQIQSREQEEREQTNKTNNMSGVNSSAERELCNTAFPVYICRLTLAWILAKILQRY